MLLMTEQLRWLSANLWIILNNFWNVLAILPLFYPRAPRKACAHSFYDIHCRNSNHLHRGWSCIHTEPGVLHWKSLLYSSKSSESIHCCMLWCSDSFWIFCWLIGLWHLGKRRQTESWHARVECQLYWNGKGAVKIIDPFFTMRGSCIHTCITPQSLPQQRLLGWLIEQYSSPHGCYRMFIVYAFRVGFWRRPANIHSGIGKGQDKRGNGVRKMGFERDRKDKEGSSHLLPFPGLCSFCLIAVQTL